MSRKSKRKYRAIETLEQGLAAYFTINAILDEFQDGDAPNIILAKFVARATLNELLATYLEKNSEEQLAAFMERLNKGLETYETQQQQEGAASIEGGNDGSGVGTPVPSV